MNPFKRELEDEVAANVAEQQIRKATHFVAANDKPPVEPKLSAEPSKEIKPNLATDVEAFVKKATTMYEGQRKYLLDLESNYDTERAQLTDKFRRRLDDLQHEAADALRECDAKHGRIIKDAKLILDRLGTLNGD